MDTARANAGPLPLRRHHRSLAWALAKRDLLGKYRGARLGMLWALATPFMMLLVYTLAFGHLTRGQWPGLRSLQDFALWVFAGLAIHGTFAECLVRAPTLVTSNPSYVTKVVFPLDLLPWPVVTSAFFHLAMHLLVLLLALLVWRGGLPLTAVALPLVLLPLLPFLLGVLWLLAAVGTYLRDIGQLAGPVATAMLFLSSAILPTQAIPPRWQWVVEWNPLTPVIDQARAVLFLGEWPSPGPLVLESCLAVVFALAAHAVFRRLRPGFADVL